MRKVFARVYELLDQGLGPEQITEQLKGAARKSYLAALEHQQQVCLFDQEAFEEGRLVVGIDEVGRGPLAGPLVAACVLLPSPPPLPFLRDSKKLRAAEREFLVPRIVAAASRSGIGVVKASEFDKGLNLHQLTFLAMSRAVKAAKLPRGSYGLLVDGKYPLPSWKRRQKAVVKGDDRSLRIAAASVLAKVHRDKLMVKAAKKYPQYEFESNVGYGTKAHREAILKYGATPIHRPNFLVKILAEAAEGIPLNESESRAHDS